MASSKRPNPVPNQKKIKAELTPDQLLIGICLLLLFGLICFVAGMLVDRLDSSLRRQEASRVSQARESPGKAVPAPPKAKVQEPPEVEGTQVSPRAAVPTRADAVPPTAPGTGQEAQKSVPVELPRTSELPPRAPAESAKATSPGEVVETAVKASPPKRPTPPTPPKTPEISRPEKPGFAVQVAALRGADRAKAEKYKGQLEAQLKLRVALVPSEDEKYIRVLVGSYPDRKSAEGARDELKKRASFKDCFVRAL